MQFMIGLFIHAVEDSDNSDGENQSEYKDQQIGKIRNNVMLDGKVILNVVVRVGFGQAEQRESFLGVSAFDCGEGVDADFGVVVITSIRDIHTVVDVR